MMDKEKMIDIVNRSNCKVGYPVPDNVAGLERFFAPGETKRVTFEELEKLSYTKGGMALLKEYLVIKDDEALKLLLGEVEPEYYYNQTDVKKLLLEGSVEQLLDCLDFGTTGVIEMVKDFAVDLEINDIRKREIITEKTGLNITNAIQMKHLAEENETTTKEQKTRRAATPEKGSSSPTRRAAEPISDNSPKPAPSYTIKK